MDEIPDFDVWQSSYLKNNFHWLTTGAWSFSPKYLNTVRNLFEVMATAICGLEPGAPALGILHDFQKGFCTTFKKHHHKQKTLQLYDKC